MIKPPKPIDRKQILGTESRESTNQDEPEQSHTIL